MITVQVVFLAMETTPVTSLLSVVQQPAHVLKTFQFLKKKGTIKQTGRALDCQTHLCVQPFMGTSGKREEQSSSEIGGHCKLTHKSALKSKKEKTHFKFTACLRIITFLRFLSCQSYPVRVVCASTVIRYKEKQFEAAGQS